MLLTIIGHPPDPHQGRKRQTPKPVKQATGLRERATFENHKGGTNRDVIWMAIGLIVRLVQKIIYVCAQGTNSAGIRKQGLRHVLNGWRSAQSSPERTHIRRKGAFRQNGI